MTAFDSGHVSFGGIEVFFHCKDHEPVIDVLFCVSGMVMGLIGMDEVC